MSHKLQLGLYLMWAGGQAQLGSFRILNHKNNHHASTDEKMRYRLKVAMQIYDTKNKVNMSKKKLSMLLVQLYFGVGYNHKRIPSTILFKNPLNFCILKFVILLM